MTEPPDAEWPDDEQPYRCEEFLTDLNHEKQRLATMLEPPHYCETMRYALTPDEGVPLIYRPKFREYAMPIFDGGSSVVLIDYCPWCGAALPPSLREEWFEEMQRCGLEPGDDQPPPDMLTDAWWRAREG
ncbi:MAG: hypothetical protein MI924_17215 [Chloroflexales bacterium]|nr:hypothetical protein [Chloroflexales bacterium]